MHDSTMHATMSTALPGAAALDLTKHVNYSLGMVLGVDEFTQEFAYLSGRDQWLARDLLGYGTVSGLGVYIDIQGDQGPRVRVTPGAALSPGGQLICVAPEQCASLNDWLRLHRADLPDGDRIRLNVVLCYRDCPTDAVPIPGEPCRSEDEAMAPSRIKDDFQLELRVRLSDSPQVPPSPDQREEDALRDFVAWLSQVEVADAGAPESVATLDEFSTALRGAAQIVAAPAPAPESPADPPPESPPDFMHGSPPAELRIPADGMSDYMRAAFRIWTTELRPLWRGTAQFCATPPDEECVLLAELDIPLTAERLVADSQSGAGPVVVNQEHRPYLIHLRLLQEWLLGGRHRAIAPAEPPITPPAEPPPGGAAPSDEVQPETAFGIAASPGTSVQFSRADHTHGTPPDPIPEHVGNSTAHAAHEIHGDVENVIADTRIAKLQGRTVDAPNPGNGQVLTFTQGEGESEGVWRAIAPVVAPTTGGPVVSPSDDVPVSETNFGQAAGAGTSALYSRADHTHGTPSLSGDLNTDAATGGATVTGIQNKPVAATEPADEDVLTFRAGSWQPAPRPAPPPANGDAVTHLPGVEYSIVAAGIVQGDGNFRNPTYNDLRVVRVENGQLFVRFNDYKPPDSETTQYIVKVLPVFSNQLGIEILTVIVTFDRFEEEVFVLRVSDGRRLVNVELLQRLEFMIEVSFYGSRT